MSNPHIELLGKTARDRVTGFSGTVSSVSFDLYGCIQAALTPPLDKDGNLVDGRWFDINRLEVTNENRVMPLPTWEGPKFGATPQTHTHGPADKPAGGIR